jgi:hypothetical protein
VGGFAGTFAERGYLAIDRMFDPGLIDAIHEEYQRQFGSLELDNLPPHLKVGDRRVQVPIELKGRLLDPMLTTHPLLLWMVEAIVGPDPLIDSLTCVTAFPGAAEQPLHRDHPSLFPGEAGATPCFALTVAVPLIDLTPETGSTLVFPRSHLQADAPDPNDRPDGGEIGYPARGGCYFMDYRLWHRGAANCSNEPRPVLYIIYARPWFTDLVNFGKHARLRLSKEDALAMGAPQRRLFRRVAAKGGADLTEVELLSQASIGSA